MKQFFCDLHVHVGSALGRAVKITGSKTLTVLNILKECLHKKGIDIVGIVDCASPLVIFELKQMVNDGILVELAKGGLLYKDKVMLVPGAEIETNEQSGAAHSVCYFRDINSIEKFSQAMSNHISNINLSSQKAKIPAKKLFYLCESFDGIMVPAHVFTPFKSFYGACGHRLKQILTEKVFEKIPTVELGLSADSSLALHISELDKKTFISNSDAHSLPKIAREYNIIKMEELNFEELLLALKNKKQRNVAANYGLDPRLGKYHRTRCLTCGAIATIQPPVKSCQKCGSEQVVMGVLDRIMIIGDRILNETSLKPKPYIHQVPLEFIPGVGKKTIDKLISRFGNEMNVLHYADLTNLAQVAGPTISKIIEDIREGKQNLRPGGGGQYGRIDTELN